MTTPRPEIARYIEASLPGASVVPIAGDASTRSFWRIRAPDDTTRVLMDYGMAFDDETDDVRLARIFREAGLRTAEILAVSAGTGCILLEDLGETSLEAATAWTNGRLRPHARGLIERAVILAANVAARGTPVLARSGRRQGPALDAERFRFEMDFFIEHYVEGLCRRSEPDGLRDLLHALADRAADTPVRVLCHRDFHSRNLMVLRDGTIAMVDIQDARWGPDTYDLASLLRDAYVEIEPEWHDSLVALYLSVLTEPPAEGFRARLDRVSAQRMLKALGTFGYQLGKRGERRYLPAVPRTVRRLLELLPRLAETRSLAAMLEDAGLLDAPEA